MRGEGAISFDNRSFLSSTYSFHQQQLNDISMTFALIFYVTSFWSVYRQDNARHLLCRENPAAEKNPAALLKHMIVGYVREGGPDPAVPINFCFTEAP